MAALVAVAIALWVLVWFVESRAESPILPIEFFRVRVFSVSMISLMLIGGGMSGAILFIPPYTVAVQNAFKRHQMDMVTSASQLFRAIGGTIGTAMFGILMTSRFAREMNVGPAQINSGLLDSVPPGLIAQIMDNPQRLASVGPVTLPIVELVRDSMFQSITALFVVGLVLMLAAMAVNF